MLKRQRPASPSPIYDATEDEKNLPEDLFEPMSKRRRYFTPSRSNSLSQRSLHDGGDEEEEEHEAESRGEHFRHEGVREWQQYAGEYRDENTKLHDLHAEQRHRMLFTTNTLRPSALLFSLPTFEDSSHRLAAPQTKCSAVDQSCMHHNATLVPPSRDNGRETPTQGTAVTDDEAQVVFQRYEETNK